MTIDPELDRMPAEAPDEAAAELPDEAADTRLEPPADSPESLSSSRVRLLVLVVAISYCWVRIAYVLLSSAFETPDTQSYRSGQGTRPPLGAALLSWLGDTPYVAMSVTLSTLGFLALAVAMWNPARRKWSSGVVATLALLSFIPGVTVYEHWLVPDSLLIGLSLLALSLAWRRVPARWHPWMLAALCLLITATKEQGIGVVLLVTLVVAIRRSPRQAVAIAVASLVLFAAVVAPASNRKGVVLWNEQATTQMTMARFRIVIAGLMWPDLSPELAEVGRRSTACGMNMGQLIVETFRATKHIVGFEHCPELWGAVDRLSQMDVLVAHLHHSEHVPMTLERAFAPNMWAMSLWSDAPLQERWELNIDRGIAGAFSMLPILALLVCVVRRRGRRLALVAVIGSGAALAAALVDPTSQDRHTIAFRVVAAAIALMALTEATELTPLSTPADDLPHVDGEECRDGN
jgi:hypothetical protein